MIGFVSGTLRVARKDLTIERRTKEVVVTTALFAALVVVLASLSFYLNPILARRIAPGVLWVSITFAGILLVGRGWAREREGDPIRALLLSPVPRASIFAGKFLANLCFATLVELLVVPLVALFFHIDLLPTLLPLGLVVLLGTIGFIAPATLFGALSVRTGARDLVLSIVVFPLVTPALLGAVVATKELFAGATTSEIRGWIEILLAFDLFFLLAGGALFEPLMSD